MAKKKIVKEKAKVPMTEIAKQKPSDTKVEEKMDAVEVREEIEEIEEIEVVEEQEVQMEEDLIEKSMHIEIADKTFTQEDFIKTVKDIWKCDLSREISEIKSIDLYVKPEDSKVYYVINNEETGSFCI
ncbi:MAG: DUF6465 family protein [Lachnospiraceae bacterium]